MFEMKPSLAATITRAASKQTYYTIRLLVDRPRVEDAYRAYAYFRWVDDVLDADTPSALAPGGSDRAERLRFLTRQTSLLEDCLRGDPPPNASAPEAMLVQLLGHAGPPDPGLVAYLRTMMLVMDFDARRRGRLVSEAELYHYTRLLATAVTEAMHHFIGNGLEAPHDPTRYAAASGAHVMHMLRDTYADLATGYFNVPREVLEASSIGPEDVHSDAYRAWVQGRVELARRYFDAGRAYFACVQSRRHRLAGLAYIARFDSLIHTLERESFVLRPTYAERARLPAAVEMGWRVASWMLRSEGGRVPSAPVAARPGRPS